MTQPSTSVAGLVFYSPAPEQLTEFYREALGVPLAPADHGHVGAHREGQLGGVHFAIWDERVGHGAGPLVPVFRVEDAEEGAARVESLGGKRLHKLLDLGEGKRIISCADPDGRVFRLLQLAS